MFSVRHGWLVLGFPGIPSLQVMKLQLGDTGGDFCTHCIPGWSKADLPAVPGLLVTLPPRSLLTMNSFEHVP